MPQHDLFMLADGYWASWSNHVYRFVTHDFLFDYGYRRGSGKEVKPGSL